MRLVMTFIDGNLDSCARQQSQLGVKSQRLQRSPAGGPPTEGTHVDDGIAVCGVERTLHAAHRDPVREGTVLPEIIQRAIPALGRAVRERRRLPHRARL